MSRNRTWYLWCSFCLAGFMAVSAVSEEPAALEAWPTELGNHRFRLKVQSDTDAVRVHLDWRRRDPAPQEKRIVIIDVSTGIKIESALRININREFGDLVFQPKTVPGEYLVYTMPHKREGPSWHFTAAYLKPESSADPAWRERNALTADRLMRGSWKQLPEAEVLGPEARSEFHRFTEMEIIATEDETRALLARHPNLDYLLFPEDRRYPIRMIDDLPQRWIESGPGESFQGEARLGEFYVFQLGLYPRRGALQDVTVTFGDLRTSNGDAIASDALRCFNLGGTDWLGRPLNRSVSIDERKVGALWFGIQIPSDAAEGDYTGTLTLHAKSASDIPVKDVPVQLRLQVKGPVLQDAGDSDLWRLARLRWLDSTIGLDDDVVGPYTPLEIDGQNVTCLGRTVKLAETGLLESIRCGEHEILAGPIEFRVVTAGSEVPWTGGEPGFVKQAPGVAIWESTSQGESFTLRCQAKMESDGYINFQVALAAKSETAADDIRLEIPLHRQFATYMMGMGRKGGYRPETWKWAWDERFANNSLWLGDVAGGLHCKLKGPEEIWKLYRLEPENIPQSWSNEGRGGCEVVERGDDRVVIRAYSGQRTMTAGEELLFNFGLLITPVKPIPPGHWDERYYHAPDPIEKVVEAGANIVNIHHANEFNPFINYPFIKTDTLGAHVRKAHANNAKVKIYYTVRELSNYVAEMWALRSLGDEIFVDGYSGAPLADHFAEKDEDAEDEDTEDTLPGGDAWLREHLIDHYAPAWHHIFPDGVVDASIGTQGLSRWHNYYLEGLAWLHKNVEIDGIYLDGIGYDREIMKRVRKVMDRTRPGSLIDFHSGNNFHENYGLSNCANQYMEHFPYIDSLWFGEGFEYEKEDPDYWLVEISGIPFGLMGEMLHGGGNPWRGMIYGMITRYPWAGDPRPVWKVWDTFGIRDAEMLGYWSPNCPVTTDRPDVLATVYRKEEKTLISVASWAEEPVEVQLKIDWKALGLKSRKAKLAAPAVEGFQEAAEFRPKDRIPIPPARGWLLILSH